MNVGIRRPPAIPGPDGATPAPQRCIACGRTTGYVLLGNDFLCVDVASCCARYRNGVTPETYAAGLRGELLTVAP